MTELGIPPSYDRDGVRGVAALERGQGLLNLEYAAAQPSFYFQFQSTNR